jgi:oligoribonuclease NrnB/cAMP/cGMP phosphodiesterase (DHH superfamily)
MEGNIHDKEEAGIVPRAVNTILEQLEETGHEFTIRVSFLEICTDLQHKYVFLIFLIFSFF